MPRLTDTVIEERIEVRRTRQQILSGENPPRLAAIIDEAVLHRVVGSPAVMAAQLDSLINACSRPNVEVQVIPFVAGAHPGLHSAFVLLEFADAVPSVVYVEGLVGQIYLQRPGDVRRYRDVFDRLRSVSLSQEASITLMAEINASYKRAS